MAVLSVGFGNAVNAEKITAVLNYASQPVKRMADFAKETGNLIDATVGKKTRTVLVSDTGQVILSALSTETIVARWENIFTQGHSLSQSYHRKE